MTTIQRPVPGPPRDYHFPRFERRELPNGLRIVVAPVAKLPLVTVLALVDAGAAAEPPGGEGLAQLTARCLAEGTAAADGAELTEMLERIGASLDSDADWDVASVGLTVLNERLPEALTLLASVLTTPSFPAREVERLRAERLSELLQMRTEPRELADAMFSRCVYSGESRYARPAGGTERSVAAITREQVTEFYSERYRPSNTTLVVVGDATADQLSRLAAETLGSWEGATKPRPALRATEARSERAVHVVRKGDAPQSEVRIGHMGVPRLHPDYFNVVVMNAILGGLFSSRINLNLRERNAYTYGAFAHFDWRRDAGPFVISTAVKSDVTADAVREVLNEVTRMREEVVSQQELSLATSYLDGVFPIRFETTAAIARALAALVVYGLPDDYHDSYRENIRTVTRDGVLSAAQTHIDPARMQVVVVGDSAVVREPLERMRIGPMHGYEADGGALD